jgi:hypothetical protein
MILKSDYTIKEARIRVVVFLGLLRCHINSFKLPKASSSDFLWTLLGFLWVAWPAANFYGLCFTFWSGPYFGRLGALSL